MKAVSGGRQADPVAVFWRRQGILPRAARALSQAGLRTPEDLHGRFREDLLALPGIGHVALVWLDEILGEKIPSRGTYWLERGLSMGAANALAREGINTLEDLGKLTREQFLSYRGLAFRTLRQCERLLGRMLHFQRRGALAR